jgi:hypothetical protein
MDIVRKPEKENVDDKLGEGQAKGKLTPGTINAFQKLKVWSFL